MKYRKSNRSKQDSGGCRNNNSCNVCKSDRTHSSAKHLQDDGGAADAFFEVMKAGFAAMQSDPQVVEEENAEVALWDRVSLDGWPE